MQGSNLYHISFSRNPGEIPVTWQRILGAEVLGIVGLTKILRSTNVTYQQLMQASSIMRGDISRILISPITADLYVAPNGSAGNPGTFTQPLATIQQAHDVAVAGNLIYVRGGTYTLTSTQQLSKDGSSGNMFRLFAYPGETPILDGINLTGSDAQTSSCMYFNSANWWHVKGLELKNAPGYGMMVRDSSSNNIVELNVAHHNGGYLQGSGSGSGFGVLGIGASNNLILNNDSHHNRDPSNGNADGFGLGAAIGTGNILRGNRAWFNSDDGYDFFVSINGQTGGSWLIENNWAWRNGYDDALNALGNGEGFKLGGIRLGTGGHSGAHTVQNNLAFANRVHAFSQEGGEGGGVAITLYNNTAHDNGGSSYIVHAAWNANSIVRNNLENPEGNSSVDVTNSDHNSWDLAVTVNDSDFQSVDFSGAAGARQADGSLPNLTFLKLVGGSDLIDKGVNVGLPFNGSAPDLGAYES